MMPQNAASAVMVLLQTLIKPTGPQDDANTVPMNIISQKTLGGNMKHSARTATPVTNIVILEDVSVSSFFLWIISLLILNPTKDKNVDADDNAAAIIPAISNAPITLGTRF